MPQLSHVEWETAEPLMLHARRPAISRLVAYPSLRAILLSLTKHSSKSPARQRAKRPIRTELSCFMIAVSLLTKTAKIACSGKRTAVSSGIADFHPKTLIALAFTAKTLLVQLSPAF